MTKKKDKTDKELDRRCQAALKRVNKHIDKLVTRHLNEMGLATSSDTKK